MPRLESLEDRLAPAVFTVDTLADTVAPDAYTSLREAIVAANTAPGDDTIDFSVTGTINLTGALPGLDSNLAIEGPGAGSLTVRRDTGGDYQIFSVFGGRTVSLSGLAIANGFGGTGGGILNSGTLTVSNCRLSANFAVTGGGIRNDGTLTISNSDLSGNSVHGYGGGIYNGGSLTISGSTLDANSARLEGGGIYNNPDGTLTVSNSTLSGNHAIVGGGLYNVGLLTVSNCTVSGNSATDGIGGGIYIRGGTTVVSNSTISGNSGGGIRIDVGPATLNNSIVANSIFGEDVVGAFTGSNNLFGDVPLGPLQFNGGPTRTHALPTGSPALNAGDNALIPAGVTADQRGPNFVRVSGGTVDIGAYEAQPLNLVVDITADENDNNHAPGDLSLREAIFLANVNAGDDTISFALPPAATVILTAGELWINDATGSTTIAGPGANLLTISGNNASRVFRVGSPAVEVVVNISGLTIANGLGGGIYSAGVLTVSSVALSNNSAGRGGGIFNDRTLTVSNSTVSGNAAMDFGGGIFNRGTLTVNNSTLSANIVNDGTTGAGAGIFNDNLRVLTVSNSTLSGNSAGSGGGIFNQGTLTVSNSTLAGNFALAGGGCIRSTAGSVTLNNSIVANSPSGGDVVGAFTGSNNLFGFMLLGPLQFNGGPTRTHALLRGSPALNAGDNTLIPAGVTTDQRGTGFARISGGAVDIGAYEVQDTDGDGISDLVDTLPTVFSNNFSDGTTTGTISNRGNQTISIVDAPDPEQGVVISAGLSGGSTPATVSVCNGASTLSVTAGDRVTVTFGSVILDVRVGPVDATFVADSGQAATASLAAGTELAFKPDTLTFIAAATNTQTVQIHVNGGELSVSPGQEVNLGDAFPNPAISGPARVTVGKPYTLALSSSGPGADTITSWTINWGDVSETISGNPSSVNHTYSTTQAYTIAATTTNEYGTWSANAAGVQVYPSFTVFTTADSGDGSLRQAILDANASLGTDTIAFNIPGAGPHTIAPLSALPTVTDAVVIDGYTQPGASANTLAIGNNAVLQIELNGAGVTDFSNGNNGLVLQGRGSTVRGMAINRFYGGITLNGAGGHAVTGCFIGTDITGTMARGNAEEGIAIVSPDNRIGTNGDGVDDAGERNVISGNLGMGIYIDQLQGPAFPTDHNVIAGNYIGTDAAGTGALGNGQESPTLQPHGAGIGLFAGNFNRIGTNGDGVADDLERNVISANRTGIGNYGGNDTVIAGNFIGTDATGIVALGNSGNGVVISGTRNRIGTNGDGVADAAERNIIAATTIQPGTLGSGVGINGRNNVVAGNYIGTDVTGTVDLGNFAGVATFGSSNLIGTNGDGVADPAERNVISGNDYAGVLIQSSGSNMVAGNYVGTNAAGTGAVGNNIGVYLQVVLPANVIGTNGDGVGDAVEGNLISGNTTGIQMQGTPDGANVVAGNLIGTDLNGTERLSNNIGIFLAGANSNLIGTNADGVSDALERNVISGNHEGVEIYRADNNTIAGNYIGTNKDGTAALGNSAGIAVYECQGNRIGTDGNGVNDAAERNVISGNATGVEFAFNASQNTVAGNFIGTDRMGTTAVPNINGVQIDAPNNTIGGTGAGMGNLISGNSAWGVLVVSSNGTGTGNAIRGNSIYDNGRLGIDLRGDGVTPNDVGDGDTGANNLQNFPVLTTIAGGATTRVAGTLNSTASTNFTLDFYASSTADPSGYGEGQRYLGSISVTTDAGGNGNFDALSLAATATGEVVTATATGPDGTSEFSYAVSMKRVSGRVFDDADNDGLFGAGDGGIGGVAVLLVNEATNALITTGTTAADGSYVFDVFLPTGTYKIVAAQPTSFLDGRETAGSLGGTVDNTQDSNQITGINVSAPGLTGDAVAYNFAEIRPSQALGLAWVDANDNGEVDFGEQAIQGVAVELTGVDDRGNAVIRSATTDANGIYAFIDLRPSNGTGYTIRESQPTAYLDGRDTLGQVNGVTAGSALVNDTFSAVVLPRPASLAENYNFGERPSSGGGLESGQTAAIGFWQNNKGQNLIKALNGGSTATYLGNWLAVTFPNMYGANSGANNLSGKTNAQVAAFYKQLFALNAQTATGGGPAKMDAQVMATALAVYVTNQNLAGTTALAYGFQVTPDGVGVRTFNVGSNGAAFGVANNSDVNVMNLLLAVNSRSYNGLLYDLDHDGDAADSLETSFRTMVNYIFSAINEAGDI